MSSNELKVPKSLKLSVVIVVYRMARQAANTLRSFSTDYQQSIAASDYEIIIVENRSDDMLGEETAISLGSNIRYFLRENEGSSPVAALLFGIEQARASSLCLVIDGARMVTPRVLQYALTAFRIDPNAVVAVPGYHLGAAEQHRNPSHTAESEQELLDRADWASDGYRLFEISVFFRGRHQNGYLLPLMESNCVFFSRGTYDAIGGVDLSFDMPGGGMVNLDLYKRLVEQPSTQLFVLAGEGTFHQFHGGVTTKMDGSREELLASFRDQYQEVRGESYDMPRATPRILGAVPGWAMPPLQYSASAVIRGLLPK